MTDEQFEEFTRRIEVAIRDGFDTIAGEINLEPDAIPNAIDRGMRNIERSIDTNLSTIWSSIDRAARQIGRP